MTAPTASWIKPLAIGNVTLSNNLIMAPMAGITDLPFRALAKKCGAGLVCTEMVSAKALVHSDKKTRRILKLSPDEHPVSVQIFGSNPHVMAESARLCEAEGADIIDINMGCPVRKVMKAGAGAKLVENEALLCDVMEATVKAVKVPVTIKIRIGMNPQENIAPRIIELAQGLGVTMVTVHGRAASNFHKGSPDLEAVRACVESARIPVVGNGGVLDEEGAKAFFEATGCAGLMIGRGAIGNPGIFTRIVEFLNTGNLPHPPSWEDRIHMLREHVALSCRYYGERMGMIILRKVAAYYLKGLPNASRIRDQFNKLNDMAGLDALLEQVWHSPYFAGTVEHE